METYYEMRLFIMRRKKRQTAKWLTAVLALLSLAAISVFGWTAWNKKTQAAVTKASQVASSKSSATKSSTTTASSSKSSSTSSSASSAKSDSTSPEQNASEVETAASTATETGEEQVHAQAESSHEQVGETTEVAATDHVEHAHYEVAASDQSAHVTTYAAAEADYSAATYETTTYEAGGYPVVLANGNTAGAVGSAAAAQIAAMTGTDAATWEYIIARESNGDPGAYNPSGASGLFQTMPGWGSTATVEDQINAAVNAYNNQGFAAWGVQ